MQLLRARKRATHETVGIVDVPMDRLNEAVVDHLEARLLDPARLEALMDQILDGATSG